QKEKLWKLINDLLDAFEISNLKEYYLFALAQELYNEGYERLFTAYENRFKRSKTILRQDIFGTENHNTTGHIIKRLKTTNNLTSTYSELSTTFISSNKRRITTEEEKIFKSTLASPELTDQLVEEVKSKLSN
ncbi:4511_t:CDS:2, partial [Scutellospora calospora]